MTRFLFRTFTASAVASILVILVLTLVWPDPWRMWFDGEWRHVLRYIGVGLILLSLLFSLRKRIFKSWGRLPTWLAFHEYSAAIGFCLILYHAFGYQFHAALPWVLMIFMGLCTGSGLFIKWLFLRATSRPKGAGQPTQGLQIKTWRPWHLWLGVGSVVLTLIHASVAYLYGGY